MAVSRRGGRAFASFRPYGEWALEELATSCPVCREREHSRVSLPRDVIGRCTLFECRPCRVRFLGAWTGARPGEDDYWSEPTIGLGIYTAPAVVSELTAKYREALDVFASALPPGARVLDVGCGLGVFLGVARERGLIGTGIDISATATAIAHERFGHDARAGTLEEQRFPDARFDLVTLWDVIEHVFDPAALMREVRRVLAPGGLVLLETPDEGAILRGLARLAYWASLGRVRGPARSCYYPAHRVYFTRPGLRALLARSGFERVRFRRGCSMRAKSRLKNASYGKKARLEDAVLSFMSVAPLLGNKIVAVASAAPDGARASPGVS